MKTSLRSILVALMVIALASGTAFAASEIDIAATAVGGPAAVDADVDATAAGSYVVGSEWLAGQANISIDLGAAVGEGDGSGRAADRRARRGRLRSPDVHRPGGVDHDGQPDRIPRLRLGGSVDEHRNRSLSGEDTVAVDTLVRRAGV